LGNFAGCYMSAFRINEIVISGMGIVSAVGTGKREFFNALMTVGNAFGVMTRPGRQMHSRFIGAEFRRELNPENFSDEGCQWTLSADAALLAVKEAWEEARLAETEPARVGIIVAGCNVQQRALLRAQSLVAANPQFTRPRYALMFMDSDVCGVCSAHFGIGGLSHSVGASSASGQVAVFLAEQAIASGQVDSCVVVGALCDLSYFELHAMKTLGAMGTDRFMNEPTEAYRPFDQDRDGFIFGENCGAIVVERLIECHRKKTVPYAYIRGSGSAFASRRGPEPSFEGEVAAIGAALDKAHWQGSDIDYVNPHGSGSIVGDDVECKAIAASGMGEAFINATKSIVGHGLSAAAIIEIIATALQMDSALLHPCRNLHKPIAPHLRWVLDRPESRSINRAMSISLGFGGISTAICLERYGAPTEGRRAWIE
jgi:malonyl-ACP decarboxylase